MVPISSLEKGAGGWSSVLAWHSESFYRTSQVVFGLGDSPDGLMGEKGIF